MLCLDESFLVLMKISKSTNLKVRCLYSFVCNVKFHLFGDPDGVRGLLNHVSDNEISYQLLQMLWEDRSEEKIGYNPFPAWPGVVDSESKDLFQGPTNLDPAKRLSAHQAWKHPWFVYLRERSGCSRVQTGFRG